MAFKLFSQDSTLFPQEKRKQFLIVILVVVVLIILVVLYFGFLRSSSPVTSSSSSSTVDGGILMEDIIKKINFDIDFLKDAHFQTLKVYGEWPLQIEAKGRNNPFMPF